MRFFALTAAIILLTISNSALASETTKSHIPAGEFDYAEEDRQEALDDRREYQKNIRDSRSSRPKLSTKRSSRIGKDGSHKKSTYQQKKEFSELTPAEQYKQRELRKLPKKEQNKILEKKKGSGNKLLTLEQQQEKFDQFSEDTKDISEKGFNDLIEKDKDVLKSGVKDRNTRTLNVQKAIKATIATQTEQKKTKKPPRVRRTVKQRSSSHHLPKELNKNEIEALRAKGFSEARRQANIRELPVGKRIEVMRIREESKNMTAKERLKYIKEMRKQRK
jgi:hypothetical protein